MLKMQIILGILKWLLKVLAWKTHAKEDDRNIKEIQFNNSFVKGHACEIWQLSIIQSGIFPSTVSLSYV